MKLQIITITATTSLDSTTVDANSRERHDPDYLKPRELHTERKSST